MLSAAARLLSENLLLHFLLSQWSRVAAVRREAAISTSGSGDRYLVHPARDDRLCLEIDDALHERVELGANRMGPPARVGLRRIPNRGDHDGAAAAQRH